MNRQIKTMGKIICFLLVWNLVLSFCLVAANIEKQEQELNQKICNLEEIPNYDTVPDFELVEVQ